MGRFFFIFLLILTPLSAQVGINTTNPQEALHIATPTGSIMVESLNAVNNTNNGGDSDNDGDMTNNTYPLYVDHNGDLTLKLETYLNTGAIDALDDTILPTNAATVTDSTFKGQTTTIIKTYTITIDRPTILEAKFNISHHIYKNNLYEKISDTLARQVANWIEVSPDPDASDGISDRKYGLTGRTYSSGSGNSVTGPFYNGHTTYIRFDATSPTVYTIKLIGLAESWNSSYGAYDSEPTYVEFATDNDFLFFRLH